MLEAAKRAGYTTGLVVTGRITHATPASFASHIYNRELKQEIAEQIVGNQPLGRDRFIAWRWTFDVLVRINSDALFQPPYDPIYKAKYYHWFVSKGQP